MKRRSNLRIEAILLSAGLALAGLSRSAVWPVLAEEQSEGAQSDANAEIVEEPDTKTAPESQEEAIEPESQGLLDSLEIVEDEKTELILPQGHVPVPVSEFLPVQEREDMLFLNPHEDLYLLHIMNDSDEKVGYTVFLNQDLEELDVALYCFDSEKNQVTDAQPAEGVLQFQQEDTVLSLDADASSDYLLVISHAGQYEELGYTAKLSEVQPQDATEADTAEDESDGHDRGDKAGERDSCSAAFCARGPGFGAGDGTGCFCRLSGRAGALFHHAVLLGWVRAAAWQRG